MRTGATPPLEVMLAATGRLHHVASTLAAQRRSDPRDDLITNLVQAEIDGQQLTDAEIAAFFVMLAVAGNDTTRQATTHALRALTDFPAQREWLLADFDNRINSAVEELIRWATPVMTFRRTAVVDTALGGQPISAGDKVVMFFHSGNWDAEVFRDPGSLDLSRHPNPHVGFGGGGVHFCLGARVARTQLHAIFSELLSRCPTSRPASRTCWRAASLTPCARCRAGSVVAGYPRYSRTWVPLRLNPQRVDATKTFRYIRSSAAFRSAFDSPELWHPGRRCSVLWVS